MQRLSALAIIWYNIDSLDHATLDSSKNNGGGFRLIAEVPRPAIDNTDFDLRETSTYTWGTTSRVDAKHLGTTNVFGATETFEFTGYLYKVIWLNTNNNLNYDIGGGCNPSYGHVEPDYILTHEMGHLAGLGHHKWHWGDSSTHTAMKTGCNSGQASLRSDDLSDINDYYN